MLAQPDDSRPTRVGRYLLTGRIGRGGMGMVYRAVDEALEREVALKTLTGEFGPESDRRKRFAIEARAAARLQHPNIVIVYELGEERGVPFIAMELLPGADLETVMRGEEPLALAEKLDVLVQVCRGLAYAHERGIVHRDIKPGNVRLLDDGTAKIMDFGIAKLGGTNLTRTGMMVGTVHYMSPEQVRGLPLDGRSDVFSVGVILYEALTGERPFTGDSPTQVLYKIVSAEPAPPPVEALGPGGPRLAAILARALAKDPAARYTADALADELCAVLQDLQQGAPAVPVSAMTALAEARRLVHEQKLEPAIAALRALVATDPGFLEARRSLRAAVRARKAQQAEPGAVAVTGYPELEATFQATATRHDSGAEYPSTVIVGEAPPLPSGSATLTRARPTRSARSARWLAIAGAAAVVAVAVASLALLHRVRAGAGAVELQVSSLPMGATVLVDGRDSGVVTNGLLRLAAPVPEQVVLTFRKAGHRDETRTVRPSQAQQPVSVTLEVAPPVLPVRTEPPGASVTVDGRPVAGVTPLDVPLDAAQEHVVSVALDGYAPQEQRLPAGELPAALQLVLERQAPPGFVAVRSAYALDVVWRGRPLARATVSPRVSLSPGRQVLQLVAAAVFLRAEVPVTVTSGAEVALVAPEVGQLNVRANPDNCQVFVDGVFVDYPPILGRSIAVGRHAVSFRWPDGVRDDQSVEIARDTPAFAFGRRAKE